MSFSRIVSACHGRLSRTTLSEVRCKGFYRENRGNYENKKGKRVYLNELQTRDLMRQLDRFFESDIEVPRIQVGKRQTIETLINEETLLLAKFLRAERKNWVPRIVTS